MPAAGRRGHGVKMETLANLFINRETELARVRRRVEDGSRRCLLTVSGPGGVGKTTLLQRVRDEYLRHPGYLVSDIDFVLPEMQSLHALRGLFLDSFSDTARRLYETERRSVEEIERYSQLPGHIRQGAEDRAARAFRDGLNENAATTRRLFIADTIERIQDTDLFRDFLALLRELDNTVVLIAGRRNDEIAAELPWAMEPEGRVEDLPVEPFEPQHSLQYFDQALGERIDQPTKQKLHRLTQGKPILLGVASTWLLQGEPAGRAPARWRQLLDLPLAENEPLDDAIREEFEYEILGPLREVGNPLNEAILYMALMFHTFDVAAATYLLSVDERSAKRIVDDLATFLFVRQDMTLHDEMRRLVLRHVWPYIDRAGRRKARYLQQLLARAQQCQADASPADRHFRAAEGLHYRAMIDIEEGFRQFVALFDEQLEARAFDLCQLLLQTIESIYHRHRLTEAMQAEVRLRRARLHNRLGHEERVEQECQVLLKTPGLSDTVRMEALSLSAHLLRLSDPAEAYRRYDEALRIEQSRGDAYSVARLQNHMGMVLRRLSRYQEAADSLKRSIRGLAPYDKLLQAAAINNLAYVYRQWMDPALQGEALRLAQKSYAMRQQLNDRRGLAYSHQTLGEIYRDYNDLIRARGHLEKARRLFTEFAPEHEREVAMVDLALANIARKEHDPALVDSLLQQLIPVLQRLSDDEGLSQAYNEYGCELRKRGHEESRTARQYEAAAGHFAQAEAYFKRSIKAYPAAYRRADNLADLALLYHYWLESLIASGSHDEQQNHLLRRKAQDAAYEAIFLARTEAPILPESRALEALGDMAYAEGKYFKAFALFYFPACQLMAPYYGTHLRRYRVVFDRVRGRLQHAPISEAELQYIAAYMVRRWQEEGLQEATPNFIDDYWWFIDPLGGEVV